MSLIAEINKRSAKLFRRAYIKRRQDTDGLYESNWYDITRFVKKWGKISAAIDDVKLNEFTHSGISLTVSNDEATFNREDDDQSLWYQYLTRYRTLIKIEAGFTADDGTEYPTVSSQGVFILSNEIPLRGDKNDVVLKGKALISVFDEVRASNVPGISGTLTAYEIVEKIRDYTDGSGNYVFQQYISAGAWTIQSTTINYVFATTSALDDLSCWELMGKMAESEGFVLLINREGGFEFRNRDPRTTAASFDLNGLGYRNMHIKSIPSYKEALNKTYNYIRVKFLDEDTITSYAYAGTTTSVDASNPSWKYGQRYYEMENLFMNTASAQTAVNALFAQFYQPMNEIEIITKFIPHLEVLDRIAIYHKSYSNIGTTLWDRFNWNEANWGALTGENFDFIGDNYKLIARNMDLDKFENQFVFREI